MDVPKRPSLSRPVLYGYWTISPTTKHTHLLHISPATPCSSAKTYGQELHEIDLPTTTSNNNQSFIQVLTSLFLMTDPTQDSEGTKNSSSIMDSTPTKDIVPNNLGWQPPNNNTAAVDDDGFTTVGKKPSVSHTLSTKYGRAGVWITRQDTNNQSIHIQDLKCCFECIYAIDPDAVILNHAKESRSARMIGEFIDDHMTPMDYNGFCDIQTFQWGKPQEGRFKTTMLFWIASNKISSDLKALRNDSNFQEFLRLGKCTLQPSTLLESRSRMIGLFMGKDPNHTNRRDLSQRMSYHLKIYARTVIPVNVVPFTEYGIKTLGFTVGLRHEATVKRILNAHPFADIDIILNAWKRSNTEEYKTRVLQHAEICKQSTAFKLSHVDPLMGVTRLRLQLADSEAKLDVVDVCTAMHSDGTGVCYVQYLRTGRERVLKAIKASLATMDASDKFSSGPTIVNEEASHAPTRVSGVSTSTKNTSIPASKWASMPTNATPIQAKPRPPTIPKFVATPPRSFTAAMRKPRPSSPRDDPSDERSDRTPRTRNSGGSGGTSTLSSRGSAKTPREIQLEQENQKLKREFTEVKTVLTKIQTQHEQQMNQMQATYQEQLKLQQAQISALQLTMAQLQQTLASQPSAPAPAPATPRKLPANKKQKATQSPSLVATALHGMSQMAVTAVNTMAPQQNSDDMAGMTPMPPLIPGQSTDTVTPNDVPMGGPEAHV